MIAREPIYAALFARVAGAADFVTARRSPKWDDLTQAEYPALVMRQTDERAVVPTPGAPAVWTLSVDVYIASWSSKPAAATVLNPLIDAVEAALAPLATTGMQDLGLPMMVQHAYIAGRIEYQDGAQPDQAVAIIPVEILCL